ncbi:MAG: hypothetical protein UY41_C0020G0002 [Candidatus Moranbacteria bacterium GW2011_GWE1_49_15]|nr:MAG: hypothetical protein UX75_C0042G0002 [Candidatus Moranbacteria bacterium GW2011_GWE2_47_10]KKW06581.1 MAG: hypothetical protein UY41_C0020G0002 [Candidatus Moranbacteria bacterium GW2011_GWE1_49_15]
MVLFVIGAAAAVYVVYVAGKEAYRSARIEKEIEALKMEAEKIRTDNGNLREKIAYLDTDEFREKVAKEKLNLKKEDEQVVEIRPVTAISEEEVLGASQGTTAPVEEEKNYMKWWRKFFSI